MTMTSETSNLQQALGLMGIQLEALGAVAVTRSDGKLRIATPLDFKGWCGFYKPNMNKPRPAGRRRSARAASERKWHERPEPVMEDALKRPLAVWWYRPKGALEAEEDLTKLPPETPVMSLSNPDGSSRLVPDLAVRSSYVLAAASLEHGWHWITGPLGTMAFHGPSVGAALFSARDA